MQAYPLNMLSQPAQRPDERAVMIQEYLRAKEATGKSFDQIADECAWTNAYTAQLFLGQAQLKACSVEKLRKAVPTLTTGQLEAMQRCPHRQWDQSILQEPLVYRLYEAVTHYGTAIKALVNEQQGDGIMSAIDMYATVESVEQNGQKRVIVTFNGKFLPHIEQNISATSEELKKSPQ